MLGKMIQTSQDALEYIQTHGGHNLVKVPEVLRTELVCMAAVSNFAHALADVPMVLRTRSVCLSAFTNEDGGAFVHVPEALKSDANIAWSAVNRILHMLDAASNLFQDNQSGMRTAHQMAANILYHFPEDTGSIVDEVLARHPGVVPCLNGHLNTQERIHKAVGAHPALILDLREDQMSSPLLWIAVQENADYLNVLPEWLKDDFLERRKPGLSALYRENRDIPGQVLAKLLKNHIDPRQQPGFFPKPGGFITDHLPVKPPPTAEDFRP